jgi:hypothetical protein
MEPDAPEDFRDDKKEKLYRKISIWAALVLSTVITIAYGVMNPPDSAEVQKMRVFFKENGHTVSKFLRMTRQDKTAYAEKKKHPFYSSYVRASEKEKEKIKALIHISMDYTPNQYWFNFVFIWTIGFASFWFIGVMAEGAIILVRKDKVKRLAERDAGKRET